MNLKKQTISKLKGIICNSIAINNIHLEIVDFQMAGTEQEDFRLHAFENCFKLVYVISGIVRLDENVSGTRNSICAAPGDFLVIPAGTEYHFKVKSDTESEYIMFCWKMKQSGSFEMQESNSELCNMMDLLYQEKTRVYKDNGDLSANIQDVIRSATNERPTECLMLFVRLLLKITNQAQYKQIQVGTTRTDDLIKKVDQYLYEHYDENTDVHQIAEVLHMSYGYLARVFRSATGMTLNERAYMIKMQKASELIREGSYNIKEVAGKLGFSNQYYFSKVFREKMGTCPKDYMKQFNMSLSS